MSHGGAALFERVQDLLAPAQPGTALRLRAAGAAAVSIGCVLALGAGRLVPTDGALGELYLASAFGPTVAIQARDSAGAFALWVRQGRVIQASVGDRPVRISQQGNRVTLTDASAGPVLVLTVTPQDRVQWESRH